MPARRHAFQVVPTMPPPARARCSFASFGRALGVASLVWAGVGAGCRGAEAPTGYPAGPAAPAGSAPRDAAVTPVDAGLEAPGDASSDAVVATCPCDPDEASGSIEGSIEGSSAAHDKLTLTRVTFRDLPGWRDDQLAEAVPSFLRSCERLKGLADDAPVGSDGHGGRARNWRKACAAAARVAAGDDAAARAMFEAEFVPYIASGNAGPTGKLTGYYVAEIRASKTRHGKFQTPVLGRPDDLVMVDLTGFIRDAHGRRIWGRMDGGKLVPYFTRREIRKGALARRGLELLYADDPVDVLFAQIEGSGKAILEDGTEVWLEFAGKNGRAYRGVGGVLRGGGFLQPGQGTMQGIRQWFHDHPTRFDEIADQDASYVFFQVSEQPGAVGSQYTILTAQRSMAVDRAFIAMSTPIWVETHAPVPGKKGVTALWRHLLIAQDTGAGIMGAVRGDIYWGDDAAAAERGGRMGGPGRYWLLLPRGVTK
jgi:membrane-bound lytic murein transglycosylase A